MEQFVIGGFSQLHHGIAERSVIPFILFSFLFILQKESEMKASKRTNQLTN